MNPLDTAKQAITLISKIWNRVSISINPKAKEVILWLKFHF